jgi:hypothetical protein
VDGNTAAIPLLAVGNAAAIVVLTRWVPVVRERRLRWFLVHHAAMAAVIAGWAIRRPIATGPNIAWLVLSTVWYGLGGRRGRQIRRGKDV